MIQYNCHKFSLFFYYWQQRFRIHSHGVKFLMYNWKTEQRCNSVCLMKHFTILDMSLWAYTCFDTKYWLTTFKKAFIMKSQMFDKNTYLQ